MTVVTRTRQTVLFCRRDSIYKVLADDVYDVGRDARCYTGQDAVIAHPPCRGWGRMSKNSVATPEEKELGIFAADLIQRNGGVLEHPWASKLWKAARLPRPCDGVDEFGGFTILVDQGWWGHKAPKPTWLYIVGVNKKAVPPMPVKRLRAAGRTLELPLHEREGTPEEFAKWLLLLAAGCNTQRSQSAVTEKAAVTRGQVRRSSYLDLAEMTIG